jgi:hypothetical protein
MDRKIALNTFEGDLALEAIRRMLGTKREAAEASRAAGLPFEPADFGVKALEELEDRFSAVFEPEDEPGAEV